MIKFETDFIDLCKSYGLEYTIDDRYIDVLFINGDKLSSLNRRIRLIHSYTNFGVYNNEIVTCGAVFETSELKKYKVLLNTMNQKYKELKYKQKLNRIKEDF